MLNVTTFEEWIVDKVKAAAAGLTPGFRLIDRVARHEITEDNLGDFAKIAPACLVGIIGDEVAEDVDNLGTVQMIDYTLAVNIVTQDKFKKTESSDYSHTLETTVASALRGLLYQTSHGNTEQSSCLRYRGTNTILLEGGLMIRIQRYELTVMDAEN